MFVQCGLAPIGNKCRSNTFPGKCDRWESRPPDGPDRNTLCLANGMNPSMDLIDRIRSIAERKSRFSYDIRSRAFVDMGIVAAYRSTQHSDEITDLPEVVQHALSHEGIVGAWRDPESGRIFYDSCRLFTDAQNAIAFARVQQQRSIYNINRMQEIPVNAA